MREEKYVNENGIRKDVVSIDKESANKQRAKRNGANYRPYWIKQKKINCTEVV